jgi:hypothetical protein
VSWRGFFSYRNDEADLRYPSENGCPVELDCRRVPVDINRAIFAAGSSFVVAGNTGRRPPMSGIYASLPFK